ncbi:MAG: UTP--glucose-1-phosphate uridylyltransferase GalU [Bacillota bacterium]
MRQVRKAIIPAAGLGTRFLPATKSIPKEMFPIVDKPTIQYIIEEAVASGISEIIIITCRGKRAIEDHFDNVPELEFNLARKGKFDVLENIRYSTNLANIHYIRQKEPKGLGHAIWSARNFIGNEPFAVLLGDDLVQSETPGILQLINKFKETNSSIVGVQKVLKSETYRYGIIDPIFQEGRLYRVNKFIEKPEPGKSPSNLAIMGRYVLTPEIFKILENQEKGIDGEIQLTDAIQRLNEVSIVSAYDFEGDRYDIGDKLGFVLANIKMALQHKELRKEVLKFVEKTLEKGEMLV